MNVSEIDFGGISMKVGGRRGRHMGVEDCPGELGQESCSNLGVGFGPVREDQFADFAYGAASH